jgi:hypothetical protein
MHIDAVAPGPQAVNTGMPMTAPSTAALREYIDDQLRVRDEFDAQRREYEEKTLSAAFRAYDERLHTLNQTRESLNDATARNITRTEAETRITSLQEKLDAKIEALHQKTETVRRPNWLLMSILVPVISGIMAVAWMVIGLQISNGEAPLTLAISQLREQSAGGARSAADQAERIRSMEDNTRRSSLADEQSRVDRAQMNIRLAEVEKEVNEGSASRRADTAALQVKLAQIETQFCANDIRINLQHVSDLRMFSILWTRTAPGETLPTSNLYAPMVCNGGVTMQGSSEHG